MRKRTSLVIRLFVLCMTTVVFTGCARVKRTFPEDKDSFTTDFAMSAVEYSIFLQKEIGVAENLIFTRMTAAKNITLKKGASNNEIENTEEDLSKLDDIIEDVEYTKPALDYETDRETLLSLLNEAKTDLESYKDALSTKGDVEGCVDKLEALYNALAGEANAYYE